MNQTSDVVIYGGGMAGAILAKRLSADIKVTLVDPRDYFEVPMAVPRNLLEPSFADVSTIPFERALPNVQMVQGKLVEWTRQGGIIDCGNGVRKKLKGKVNVLATGSRFANSMMRPDSGTREERQSFYQQNAHQIANAKRVVIVGGGPIGVEMAGEISSHFPETQITLIESGSRILRGTSASASLHATRLLKKRGIQILTDDKLLNVSPKDSENSLEPKELVTAKGVQLSFDLLLWCTGAKPNTDYMQPYFSNALDLHQRICVTTALRVVGEQMLFAVGDINNVNENKMAWHVAGQVECAEKNIRRVLAGQVDDSLLTQYKPKTGNQAMAVTFGPDQGMVNLPPLGLITAGWLNRRIKSSHMLVPKYRKILGV